MSVERNSRNLQLFFDAINHGDMDKAYAFLSPKFLFYYPGLDEPLTHETYRLLLDTYHIAFPDMFHELFEQTGKGDTLMTWLTLKATHKGAFQHIPATGKTISLKGMHFDRFDEDGLIIETRTAFDRLLMYKQLGLIDADFPKGVTFVND